MQVSRLKVSHANIVHSILTFEIRVRFQRDHFGAECVIGAVRSIISEFCSRKTIELPFFSYDRLC